MKSYSSDAMEVIVPPEFGFIDLPSSEFMTELCKLPVLGYVKVTIANRPDLYSYQLWGTYDMWWLLLYYNGIYDYFEELPIGTNLAYFDAVDYQDLKSKYGLD